MKRKPTRDPGFALLPVVLLLSLLGITVALLLEGSTVEHGIVDNRQRADSLGYAAEAGFAHVQALLDRSSGCAALPTLPATTLAAATYSATLTPGVTAPSATYSFVSVADAWIDSGNAASNNGSNNDLKVQAKSGSHYRALLRFDFSALPPNVDVASASLNLHVKNDDKSGDPVEIYPATVSWNEATVSWSSAATSYDGAWRQAYFVPGANGSMSVDITRLVRAWIAGAVPNRGLYLVATSIDEDSVYSSREEGDATRRPRIDVTARSRIEVAVSARAASSDGVERVVSGSLDGPADGALALDYINAGYSGNDGTVKWAGDWQEIGESNGPSAGAVRVVASGTCAYGNCLKFDAGLLSSIGAWRALNLLGARGTVLRVDTRRAGGNWTLQVSANGGASWQTLKSVASGTDSKQQRDAFDISAYASANMRIRFTSAQLLGLGTKDVYIDNLEVEAACAL